MVPSNVTSDTQEKKKGGQQEPDHLCQMVFLHCRLTTVHTSSLHTHAHARTDTQTHRLCAVRSNVLPYNPGYSINKLRECEIDYFFSLTVSHPSAQAYVDTHADTSTHSHCPAPPSPSLMFTKRV